MSEYSLTKLIRIISLQLRWTCIIIFFLLIHRLPNIAVKRLVKIMNEANAMDSIRSNGVRHNRFAFEDIIVNTKLYNRNKLSTEMLEQSSKV